MLRAPSQNSWWWTSVMENVYRYPEPAPRKRTKPMEVICVGMPRSGTESLQQALSILGYDYTFHGWDMVFEDEPRMQGWVRLMRKKWYGTDGSGTATITAAEFDELLGHSVAVTDTAASMFAVELIDAYPEAKIVLNMRRDLDAWHKSAIETLLAMSQNRIVYISSFFNGELFWCWHGFMRYIFPALFRSPDGDVGHAIRNNGKLVYRDHCNMIRGMVPKERLLEWYIGDGWEPLCKFLGKPIPDEEFPHVNTMGKGWKDREAQLFQRWVTTSVKRMALLAISILVAGVAVTYKWYW